MSDKVLFVDDEPLVLQALARMLHFDFDIHMAPNGYAAVEMLAADEYALIVSDMKMPGMSGALLLKHCYENYPRMARLLLTAHCDLDEQASAIGQGHIHGMLYKPCTPSELRNALQEALWRLGRTVSEGNLLVN